ncbi:MAG TPA: dicarboxylate/amino acid:cation symporter [Isosphaeraceae bacterium]|jgi:DAACS family dicarboxylate/amino acid:cation (Na+ or H+) symporter|nr:dicarboxylate/amino acid:cation symporter [Isosphaeraceae bacterium]
MASDETEDISIPMPTEEPESRPGGVPLFVWVLVAVALAIPVGLYLGPAAARLSIFADLIIRALKALAAPLVVLAILSAIVTNDIRGRQGARMMFYYLINTLVAMVIGLGLSNLVRPGDGANLADIVNVTAPPPKKDVTTLLIELIPQSVGEAFAQNNLAQLVLLTLALGIGLAKIRNEQRAQGQTTYTVLVDLVTLGFELLMRVLLWVVALVPLAVFGIVAASVGKDGFRLFLALGWFIGVVLVGLTCQIVWYLVQMAIFAQMSPLRFLRGAADVMAATFSTASTAATMPVTLKALTGPLRVSRASSQLAACVGTNFNNDGTALYQAGAVLFLAQALGFHLSPIDQVIIMLTTLVASVGAGGIPSGSFVTLPLIFAAVGLQADKLLPVLLTVDWFLDRCRTTSNVLGDMTVAVLLDRTAQESKPPADGGVGPAERVG